MEVRDEMMGKIMGIHDKIQQAIKKMYDSEEEDETTEEDKTMEDKMMELQRLFDERSEIIKDIPNFWLTAFLSHYALGVLLSEEDQKIFRFLTSVIIEDSEGSPSGYTITWKFADNQYFHDANLVKKYSGTGVEISSSTINWKDTVATTGNQQESLDKGEKWGYANADRSFFTWFSDRAAFERTPDQVANLIADDLWPNAVEYYLNGNFTCAKEKAIDEDCRLFWNKK